MDRVRVMSYSVFEHSRSIHPFCTVLSLSGALEPVPGRVRPGQVIFKENVCVMESLSFSPGYKTLVGLKGEENVSWHLQAGPIRLDSQQNV